MSELREAQLLLRRLKMELRVTEDHANVLKYRIREQQRIILATRPPVEHDA